MGEYTSFDEAFYNATRFVFSSGASVAPVQDPASVGSRFGKARRSTREVLGHQFTIEDPRRRLVSPRLRKINIAFAIANTLWTLSGARDLELITFYNPRGRDFSRDGIQFEAAFGDRLFGGENQLKSIEMRLLSDPTTRRALGVIYDRSDSLNSQRLDVPCAIGLQFLLRADRLDCVTLMRSQSAVMVLPYDVFLFSMLQEILACRIGCTLGSYRHYSVSFHYYEDEAADVAKVCEARTPISPMPMDEIQDASDGMLRAVLSAEQDIRAAYAANQLAGLDIQKSPVDDFWKKMLGVLMVYAFQKSSIAPREEQWSWLPPGFRSHLW